MHQNTVIGLDVGRSAVKAVAFANGLYHRLTFPSLVSPAIEIADENSSLIAERETVEIAGKRFFTGDTARLQGGAGSSVGLSDDWIDTPEYQALIASALKRLAGMNVRGLDNPYIVLGTPAHIYGTQRQRLVERTQEVIMTEMKVLPQPMGAFLSFFYDAKGTPILANARDETGRPRSWAVVDVGHYTTDFLLMREGNYIERCAGSCEGTNNAVEHLNRQLITKNIHTTLIDCEAALRTKSVRHFGTKDVSAGYPLQGCYRRDQPRLQRGRSESHACTRRHLHYSWIYQVSKDTGESS